MVWAVVPVKSFCDSKQRLASVLGHRRENFARAMMVQTLTALISSKQIAGTLVVTADPEVALEAQRTGASVLEAEADLNTACTLGLAKMQGFGANVCAIFHADLARISPRSVGALVSSYLECQRVRGGSVVGLVRCHEGTGTNAVLLDPRRSFAPQFGVGSFAAHLAALGPRAVELFCEDVAFDVDTAEDFEALALGTVPVRMRPFVGTQPVQDPSSLIQFPLDALVAWASELRNVGHDDLVTYSRKVFLPLTHLCRDSCHYCTFAEAPRHTDRLFMSVEEAVVAATIGAVRGCKEALFTLGEKPEVRYRAARAWLAEAGFKSTLHYVAHVAGVVQDRTGLLPHINAGCMTADEIAMLRPVSASMGLMLESSAERLCRRGGPHYGSPDKAPSLRLATIAEAGRQRVPFTTGILIGIGETRAERIDSLLAIRELHERFGHIQEIIVQNFSPKPGTRMASVAAPPLEELIWTVAAARVLFGPYMNIQVPPNLNAGCLVRLIGAGINDWGGVSPVTPDFVNPEAPWPEIERLREETASGGKVLAERLTIYPHYAREPEMWLDPAMRQRVLELSDAGGNAREDGWRAGRSIDVPTAYRASASRALSEAPAGASLADLIEEITAGRSDRLGVEQVARLFSARGGAFTQVCAVADQLRESAVGDVATYVINRNINYTNICTYGCGFCAFSKGKRAVEGAEKPYLLTLDEIGARAHEAWLRGATEVCLQGGIHPTFTGRTYLQILRAVKEAVPGIHVHAFSPLEVWNGATTLGLDLVDYLSLLRDAGLGSLPGTAAEVLDDKVRQVLCPDKLNTQQWLEVIETAHRVGLQTTATIMFGHVDDHRAWARHLLAIRDLQKRTGGFTEFVPLPFVAHEAPLYKRGRARPGPTFREALLMHAVARIVLFPHVPHIQASWVKMGREGVRAALNAGADDLGGTLMNESITRAAGAIHGQEMEVTDMGELASSLGRTLVRRTTLYARHTADAHIPKHDQVAVS